MMIRGQLVAGTMSALILASLLAVAVPLPAAAQEVHAFNVSTSDPASAIRAFGAQAGIQILASADDLKGKKFNPVTGDIPTEDGLNNLLAGTGLDHRYVGDRAVALVSNNPANAAQSSAVRAVQASASGVDSTPPILIAQAADPVPSRTTDKEKTTVRDAERSAQLEEIIVTAEKRSERIQDTPVPVSVINTAALVNSNQMLFRDYYSSVPGLSLTTTTQSSQILSIRGIVTNPGNPTVGITVDDMPFGSSTIAGGGLVVPDFDPGDLSQIEVLRGPQGTLYGASSLGGLIKFVTIDPSTDRVSGNLQAGLSSVHNGNEVGYMYRGAVNVPLNDSFAVRASGFARLDPGYIDNPVFSANGLNAAHADGGLLSALWKPSQDFSLKLNALLQEVRGDGSSDVDMEPGLGDLQQNYLPGVGAYKRSVQAYSATVKAKLGDTDLISISGYNVNKFSDSWDYTFALAPFTLTQFGVSGTPILTSNKTNKFTQELRLSSSIAQSVDWSLGAFYTHESSQYEQFLLAANSSTGAVVGTWCDCSSPSTYTEYAVFPDLTFHVTNRFDVQVGARASRIRQTFLPEVLTGPYAQVFLGVPSPVIVPAAYASGNPFTYLVTPRYQVSPDLMVYARLASGYRAGGSNQGVPGVPPQYNPDKTQNYEIGAKGDFFDHMLSFDASIYYIAWKDIQLSFIDPQNFMVYTGNGTAAKSQGVELSIKLAPSRGLAIEAWVTYDDAVLTEAFPAAVVAAGEYGLAGDRLPFGSRYSGYVSVDRQFPLASRWIGFVGGDMSYVGDRIVAPARNPFRVERTRLSADPRLPG